MLKRLVKDKVAWIERRFKEEIIKRAVFDCVTESLFVRVGGFLWYCFRISGKERGKF